MNDGLNGFYRLEKDDVERVAEMLTRAFYDDPLTLYAYSDRERESGSLLYFFQFPVRYCLRYGEGYAPTSDIEGVALWLPSNKYPITFWRTLRTASLWFMFKMMRKIGSARLKRMAYIGGFLDKAHERLAPFEHMYLQVLGVDPERQGKGYASKLLKTMFNRLDEEGMPCYLDTLKEENVAMYEHLGFKVLEKIDIPDTDITSWALLREPR
jgi:ribosomal protein S18 acetylase RimI-like enzyme